VKEGRKLVAKEGGTGPPGQKPVCVKSKGYGRRFYSVHRQQVEKDNNGENGRRDSGAIPDFHGAVVSHTNGQGKEFTKCKRKRGKATGKRGIFSLIDKR